MSDSEDSFGEFDSDYSSEEDDYSRSGCIKEGDTFIYNSYSQLVKVSNDKDFRSDSERIYSFKHFYRGRVLHGMFELRGDKDTKLFVINGGNLMSWYDFPTIEHHFSSPMINYENLHLCGGWSWKWNGPFKHYAKMSENEILLHRVLNGLKPMAEIIGETAKVIEMKRTAEDRGFIAELLPIPQGRDEWWKTRSILRVANPAAPEKLFNLDQLDADYAAYFKKADFSHPPRFDFLRGKKMRDVIDIDIDWGSSAGMHVVGLLLGFPIESTIDRLIY